MKWFKKLVGLESREESCEECRMKEFEGGLFGIRCVFPYDIPGVPTPKMEIGKSYALQDPRSDYRLNKEIVMLLLDDYGPYYTFLAEGKRYAFDKRIAWSLREIVEEVETDEV
jgi:hypothetical protein